MMGRVTLLLRRIAEVFRRNRVDDEIEAEIRFHLDMQTREYIERGMDPEEARLRARRDFGGVQQVREECHDERGMKILETTWQDVRYAFRTIRKNPGFSAIAILTLALGIGANAAIFSMIWSVLLRPLPYRHSDRLVVVRQVGTKAGSKDVPFSVHEIEDYRQQSRTLDALVEYHAMNFTLLGEGEPDRVETGVVSANFFDVLGVRPLSGRTFVAADDGPDAPAVLVLSYPYWHRKFHGDAEVVGKTVEMNDRVHTIVGVLPPIPQYPDQNDVYMPTSACPSRSAASFIENRDRRMMRAFGLLKSGATVENGNRDVAMVAANLTRAYPASYPPEIGYTAAVSSLRGELTQEARPTLLVLLGTAILVLLIVCANVANLSIARLAFRERELAIRTAMGAGRRRLIRQLLTESTVLALLGGVVGLGFAAAGMQLLVAFAERLTPRAHEISIDGMVLAFTAAVSILTGLLFGSIPAFSSESRLMRGLYERGTRGGGPGGAGVRGWMITCQVAVSFMLLICAGLAIRSLRNLQQVQPGFRSDNVLTMRIPLNWTKYDKREKQVAFFEHLLDRLHAHSGVVSAAVGTSFPLSEYGVQSPNDPNTIDFRMEGKPIAKGTLAPRVDYLVVSREYFETLRIPLLRGRLFGTDDDEEATQVAVVNQSMADHRWGREDPIGKRITFDDGENWVTIVGVVGNVKQVGLAAGFRDEIYRPFSQVGWVSRLLVRTTADPRLMATDLRSMVRRIDPQQPVTEIRTLEQVRGEALASPRLISVLLGLFGALALVITASGIGGVIAFTVGRRTHEIGVRIALGATPQTVLSMVLREGLRPVISGLILGLTGALLLSRLMAGLLFEIEPLDPTTFLGAALVLACVAVVACLLPARRAVTIQPMVALRTD